MKNASSLAYSVRNMQLTAFIQDPTDSTSLTPLATLLPNAEPEGGYTLGPLVPERGPFIFSNDLIFPNLVERLMQNPRGLTFAISNFDIEDELGRNFAFSSQEVAERTVALVIDNGSFDTDGDGEGDLTEYHRVAIGSGRVIDTNGDGKVDKDDRRVTFDDKGKQVGITLKDALAAIGLTRYDEETTATSTLTDREIENSYSTIVDEAGVEKIFRIRGKALKDGVPKSWEILTPTGIDQTIGLDDFILRPDSDIKLVFAQDLDQDRMPANVEYLNNCSDTSKDTDGDGLDDRTEVLIGREVETGQGTKRVYTSCSMADTDQDGLDDAEEANGNADCDGDGAADTEFTPTDPTSRDTDGDKIEDKEEVCGYEITLRSTGETITARTDPTNPDSDGDTANDGVEKRLGGNPNDDADRNDFADDDDDGLVNVQETDGWEISVFEVSDSPAICNSRCDQGTESFSDVTSDPSNPDTDGDGLLDGEEKFLGTDPQSDDTDGDGLGDLMEVRGFELRDLGIIVTDPVDADTDDDKRSDGEEADLDNLEQNRWIVRVAGEKPYQVWSNPLLADEDFDTLADGDEFAAGDPESTEKTGTDPTYYNTDKDKRDDAVEVKLGLNPLSAQDFMVQQLTVRVDKFYCAMADDEGTDNTVDMDRFQVTVNGYNCTDINDSNCVQMFAGNKTIYYETNSGEWEMDAGDTHWANSASRTEVTLEYNIDNYDFASSKLYLWGWARDYDGPTGSDENGYGETTIIGRDFMENSGVHYFSLTSSDFTIDAYVTIMMGVQVPCTQAVTSAGKCVFP